MYTTYTGPIFDYGIAFRYRQKLYILIPPTAQPQLAELTGLCHQACATDLRWDRPHYCLLQFATLVSSIHLLEGFFSSL